MPTFDDMQGEQRLRANMDTDCKTQILLAQFFLYTFWSGQGCGPEHVPILLLHVGLPATS